MSAPHILREAVRHGVSITLQGDKLKLASAAQPPARIGAERPGARCERRLRDGLIDREPGSRVSKGPSCRADKSK